MKKVEMNQYNMFKAVDAVLSSNTDIVETIPVLANAAQFFNTTLAQIETKHSEFEAVFEGKTQSKNAAEDEMITMLLPLASSLKVYAVLNDMADLKNRTQLSFTSLKRMRDLELLAKAKDIMGLAESYKTELADFGYDEPKIASVQELVESYESALGGQDTGSAERSAARQALFALFDKANDQLNEQLDDLMELFRISNPDFYNEYKSARVIIDV